jgi:arylsulfatase
MTLLLSALGVTGLSCAESRRPNILFIVIDTLRADRLGVYGAERNTSPAIDVLAAQSVRFTRAYSTSSWTKPAVASLLTGLYPSTHQVNSAARHLPEAAETLAEILSAEGYRTFGVVSHYLLTAERGFAQGFDAYAESEGGGAWHVSTPGVTMQASEVLKHYGDDTRPFFLFVHYFDPHNSYLRHPEVGFSAARVGRLNGQQSIVELREIMGDLSAAELDYLRDVYDEEIRFTDTGIGRLLGLLRELDLDANTVVVLTADHGEEFLDHGWIGHSRSLYEELVRVPLLIRAPSSTPRIVAAPVSIASIAPTILDLVGIETAGRGFQADSLAPFVTGTPGAAPESVLAEVDYLPPKQDDPRKGAFKQALVGAQFKLIYSLRSQTVELYDLQRDPAETDDISDQHPEIVARMRTELAKRIERVSQPLAGVSEHELSDDEIETLRALGYAE